MLSSVLKFYLPIKYFTITNIIPAMNTTPTKPERINDAPLRLASSIEVNIPGRSAKNIITAIVRPIIAVIKPLIANPLLLVLRSFIILV